MSHLYFYTSLSAYLNSTPPHSQPPLPFRPFQGSTTRSIHQPTLSTTFAKPALVSSRYLCTSSSEQTKALSLPSPTPVMLLQITVFNPALLNTHQAPLTEFSLGQLEANIFKRSDLLAYKSQFRFS